jgi:hypothetical protein
MDQVFVLLVPTGMREPEFERALQQHLVFLQSAKPNAAHKVTALTDTNVDASEPWTWFLPNPIIQPK